jgi:K+-sensing histidine kinase KdpD
MQESLQSIWETVNADLVTFYPYDYRRNTFHFNKVEKNPKAATIPISPEEDASILKRLLQQGEYFATDAKTDEILGPRWAARYKSSSVASITLGSKEPGYRGIIVLHYTERQEFDEELRKDIILFSQFAAMAAHLIKQQEQHEAKELRQSIIRRLVGVSDSDQLTEILQDALRQNWPNVPVLCRLLLVDRGKRRLYSPLAISNEPKIPFGDDHIAGQVAESRKSLIIEDAQSSVTPRVSLLTTRSALYVPVELGDSLLGVLGVESPEAQVFDEMDQNFLEEIAGSAATALGAAGRGKHARAVIAAAARAAASSPEQELRVVTESAHEIATIAGGKPTSATVFLLNGPSLELVSAWPPDLFGELQKEVGILPLERTEDMPRGIVAMAADQRKSIIVNKLPNAHYISFDPRTRAELAVPVLAADDSVVGVLNLEYEEPTALNEEHTTLLELLADQAAIVAILKKHAEQKQQQRAALALLGVEVAAITHEWINNTTTVRDNLELVRQLSEGIADEIADPGRRILRFRRNHNRKAEELLKKLELVVKRTEGVLNDVSKPLQAKEHIHDKRVIPVNRWLQKIQSAWSKLHSEVEIYLNTGTKPEHCVYANEYWLTRAINNLLQNAVRAVQGHTPQPKVQVSSYLEEYNIRIEIWDNGPGIPDSKQSLLFNTLVPPGIHDSHGHGTGCLFTSLIVQEFGGQALILKSREGGRVALDLPLTHARTSKTNPKRRDDDALEKENFAG